MAASAGASAGRARGSGTGPVVVAAAATAKIPGRCRGKGTGPRIGSSGGRTSAAAVRAGGGGGGSRVAAKSGGPVVFGLGHAIPRSEELGALVEAALSVDRGTGLGAVPTDAVAGLAVDASLVAVAAGAAIAGEGVCAS
ncbi:MAG: hypothetical protein WBO12_04365, partial [Xanthobacteraceae bacterium]